jgi:hypothetical protein
MAWTLMFLNKQDKMDLYNFMREGQGEVYLHIADWEDCFLGTVGIHVAAQFICTGQVGFFC